MPLVVYTEGGTNAGWKTAREPRRLPWTCRRGHINKANHATCMGRDCRERRPAKEQRGAGGC